MEARNRGSLRRVGVAFAVAAMLVLASAPGAGAVDIIEEQTETAQDGWQAGTCTVELTCSPESPPSDFFTQAAGHTPFGFTQIWVKHSPVLEEPVGNLKTVLVDLPPGLSVNPQATPQCELENGKFPVGGCPANTQVGVSLITAFLALPSPPVPVPVYNLVPRQGEPARFGFALPLGLGETFLNAGVAWESDYHEYFTIHVPSVPAVKILKNRLSFFGNLGQAGAGGAFLTTPSTCNDPEVEPFKSAYTTYLHADSVEEPAPGNDYDVAAPAPPSAAFLAGSELVAAPLPKGVKPTGCEAIPFRPGVDDKPGTTQTDSPEGPTVDVTLPFEPAAPLSDSNVRTARVTLPLGNGLNPSAAQGLQTCTDAQFAKGTRNAVNCPAASKIGVVSVETPPLPAGSLKGDVYVGKQLSRDPASGEEYRIFIVADSVRYGISARLIGNVSADPNTGQLTTTISNAPQVPFTSVKLDFNDGARAVLTSAPTCGPNTTTGRMTPWSGTADAIPSSQSTLTQAPGGGGCAKTLAERPFNPGYDAKTTKAKALAYNKLTVNVSRKDGEQELKGINVTLPRGMSAKLKGVSYCPVARLNAAAANSGTAEDVASSCPSKSLIGSAAISAGSGPDPIRITGKAFLSGPYKGAPLSVAIVTPATAGPFDLGTVVVRVALRVDPKRAQVQAISDPIPHVYGGALLSLRSVSVKIDRKKFMVNPTNCGKKEIAGALLGGGADPTSPTAFSTKLASAPFRASGCKKLRFKPKLHLRLFGKTNRAQHPRLRAVLVPRKGDANIARASVNLPHAIFLDQGSLATVCTRVQYAANKCPKRSVYGHAKAFSPLLAKPLKGPVYLRSSDNPLPDMVAALRGQVNIELSGRIDTARGGIRTTYDIVPDVPVSKFILTLPGGKHGLLEASRDLCAGPVRAIVRFKGQNGKKANSHPTLRVPCGKPQGRRSHRP